MAIPCGQCGMPVHDRAVVCPHCAGETGVDADPIAVAEISLLLARQDRREPLPLPLLVQRATVARPEAPVGVPRAIVLRRR